MTVGFVSLQKFFFKENKWKKQSWRLSCCNSLMITPPLRSERDMFSVLLVLALAFMLLCRKTDVPWYWKLCLVFFSGVWFLPDQFSDLACLCEVLFSVWESNTVLGSTLWKLKVCSTGLWATVQALQHRAVILNICFYYLLLMKFMFWSYVNIWEFRKQIVSKPSPVFWLSYT